MITEKSIIDLYRFHYNSHPDKHRLYTLVRSDTLDTFRVDKKVIEVVELLKKGQTVRQIERKVGFAPDVTLTIIKLLQQANFVKSIDHVSYDKTKFTEDSTIQFFRLRYALRPDENGLYALVRWDTDDSVRVDKKVIDVVELLKKGKTIREVAKEIGYAPDIVATVLEELEKAHFFKSIDGIVLADQAEKITPWITNIDRKWFRWILCKPFLIGIISFALAGTILGFWWSGVPSYKAFFWTADTFTVFVSLFVAGIVLVILHEWCHFFATKAVGGEANMRLSYRYIFVIAETDSYHLAVVPKNLRYIIYLAGPIFDLFVVASIYFFFFTTNIFHIDVGMVKNFLLAVVLIQINGILWQFDAFLETDMYNILSEFLGIENLRSDALKYIDLHTKQWRNAVFSPFHSVHFFSEKYAETSDDLRILNKTEKRKLLFYVVILIIGLAFTTLQYFFYIVPRDVTFVLSSIQDMGQAMWNVDLISLIKSLVIIILVTYQYFLLFYLKMREHTAKQHSD